ncbi:MAG: copper chaperone CopZ [Candidatus Limnocylindrales bacterium]
MSQTTLSVPDISCEHCERTITETLSPVDGVRSVKVDIPTKAVTVDYDETTVSVDRFKELLKEEDYPVAEVS